ncbi:MAG: SixA phosphatase family protein [Thiohalospira sp.]
MELIVFRHGIALERDAAEEQGLSDEHRPLTEQGEQRTRAAARGLVAWAGAPEIVAASPLVRAGQTAALLAAEAGEPPVVVTEALTPGRPPGDLDGWLQAQSAQRLAVVGHEPDLSHWLLSALCARPAGAVTLKKAGAARLEGRPGSAWTLTALLPPRLLRTLGEAA